MNKSRQKFSNYQFIKKDAEDRINTIDNLNKQFSELSSYKRDWKELLEFASNQDLILTMKSLELINNYIQNIDNKNPTNVLGRHTSLLRRETMCKATLSSLKDKNKDTVFTASPKKQNP